MKKKVNWDNDPSAEAAIIFPESDFYSVAAGMVLASIMAVLTKERRGTDVELEKVLSRSAPDILWMLPAGSDASDLVLYGDEKANAIIYTLVHELGQEWGTPWESISEPSTF